MEASKGVGKHRPGAVALPGGGYSVPDAVAAPVSGKLPVHELPTVVTDGDGNYSLVGGSPEIPGYLSPTVEIDPTPTILPDQGAD